MMTTKEVEEFIEEVADSEGTHTEAGWLFCHTPKGEKVAVFLPAPEAILVYTLKLNGDYQPHVLPTVDRARGVLSK